MMLTSSSSSSNSSCSNSPISQHPHPQAYFPPFPRRRESAKYPRYYSTPLRPDSPESTPLQLYGLEQREPSIYGDRQSKLLRRFSHALDDIKEDFSLQLDPRTTTEKIRSKRRQSTLILDTNIPGSRAGSLSGPESPVTEEPPRSRPMSMMSNDHSFIPATRRLSRRLSMLGFRKHRLRGGQAASISQPNLIGSSTQM
ncbi:hypothetical protein BDV28DRAFT_136524 [Aspergillus coremiiformis]|uniref:Uncharacterized protein n=1 Tax=Aspergillus coremiiformis TaxID=138285 RepID=A0A5N6Z4W2_9EURO|nr:hypothetical protein BDV28DRAFT_136524 [Aspergillus coremiiformis]